MNLSTAFEIVLDLAKQNVIDKHDDKEEHARQMAAIRRVEAHRAIEAMRKLREAD
jgi:hypothetical protein